MGCEREHDAIDSAIVKVAAHIVTTPFRDLIVESFRFKALADEQCTDRFQQKQVDRAGGWMTLSHPLL